MLSGCAADPGAEDTDAATDATTSDVDADPTALDESSSSAADPSATTSGDTGEDVLPGRVLFLNFDGGTFAAGPEDAALDQPGAIAQPGPFEPAPDYTNRALIVSTVSDALAPFDIAVTDVRPTSGDYDMVVYTVPPGGPGVALASTDCGDAIPRDVGIVYVQANPTVEASAALAILGQAIGLELAESEDAMSWVNLGALEYADACVPVYMPSGCAHPQCPAGEQNAYTQMIAVVGAAQ